MEVFYPGPILDDEWLSNSKEKKNCVLLNGLFSPKKACTFYLKVNCYDLLFLVCFCLILLFICSVTFDTSVLFLSSFSVIL